VNGSHGKPPSVRDRERVPPVTAGHGGGTVADLNARKRRKASVTSNVGGRSASSKPQEGKAANGTGRYRLADALRLQGLPEGFLDDAPFTAEGKLKAVANGVPLPMGRAIAKAVLEAVKPTNA
jgi:site-specific DNA-cytosine methylase